MKNFRELKEVVPVEYELFNSVWTVAGTSKEDRIANVNKLLTYHIFNACTTHKIETKSLDSNSLILYKDLQINLIVKDSTFESEVFTGMLKAGDYSDMKDFYSGEVINSVEGIKLAELLTSDDLDYQITIGAKHIEISDGDLITDRQMIFRSPDIITEKNTDQIIEKLVAHQKELTYRLCSHLHSVNYYALKPNGSWSKQLGRYFYPNTKYKNFSQFLTEIQEDLRHMVKETNAETRLELNIAQYVGGNYVYKCLEQLILPKPALSFLNFISARHQGVKVRKHELLNKNGKLQKMIKRHPHDQFMVYLFETADQIHFEYMTMMSYDRTDPADFEQRIKKRFEEDYSKMSYDMKVIIPTDGSEQNAMYFGGIPKQEELISQFESETFSNFMKAR